MRPSIFLHLKKRLICTAMLSTLALTGCQIESSTTSTTTQQPSVSDASHYQSVIDAAQGKPSMDVLRAFISQEPLLTDPAQHQANIDSLWQMLTQMKPEQIQGIEANENILLGWVDLLDIYQNNKDDPEALRTGIEDWKTRYPHNPGAKNLPSALVQGTVTKVGANPRIALFLPMSGQGQVFGQAIMQGFLDAQKGLPSGPASQAAAAPTAPQSSGNDVLDQIYQEVAATVNENANSEVAASSVRIDATPTNTQNVKVFDTQGKAIPQLVAQATSEGYNLIVGPLLKPEVQAIAQMNMPVNVLALNELDANQLQPRANLCYFSLSPEDEAKNAANQMRLDGKQMPLVLVPASPFGDRIAKAFAEEWQAKGGGTALMQTFGSTASLKESINRGQGIRMTGTPISVGTQGIAPTSGSVDAVYIVATRDELTLVKPMIDMAISSRQRPALYASSRSNQGNSNADYRFEMEGVKFSEVPLLAGANNNLRKQAQGKVNNDYSLFRLYAMGIDAWSLANNYDNLQQHSDQFRVNGASGTLSVHDNCVIYRELPWLQFKQGQVKPAQ